MYTGTLTEAAQDILTQYRENVAAGNQNADRLLQFVASANCTPFGAATVYGVVTLLLDAEARNAPLTWKSPLDRLRAFVDDGGELSATPDDGVTYALFSPVVGVYWAGVQGDPDNGKAFLTFDEAWATFIDHNNGGSWTQTLVATKDLWYVVTVSDAVQIGEDETILSYVLKGGLAIVDDEDYDEVAVYRHGRYWQMYPADRASDAALWVLEKRSGVHVERLED